ncbi:SprT-like family-domain-containing protein [Rhypophila decipiens]|uniref:SprT-like family-domain-containing protein n=1 Tax=Rhypophila decipiens TaxID=261697 RepID=A0AAN6YFP2_9PEZI|nr:SprT-like family-domain-containing protein [Rhypophila decipiens]
MPQPPRTSRPTRPLWDNSDDESDDEFPDITFLAKNKIVSRVTDQPRAVRGDGEFSQFSQNANKVPKAPAAVRRRKLAPIANNNALLRAWTPESPSDKDSKPRNNKVPRVELRTKSTRKATKVPLSTTQTELTQEDFAEEEEVTIIEEVSIIPESHDQIEEEDDSDDVFQSAESNVSTFEDDDDSDDSLTEFFARTQRPKKSQTQTEKDWSNREGTCKKGGLKDSSAPPADPKRSAQTKSTTGTRDQTRKSGESAGKELRDTFSRLHLDDIPILNTETIVPRPKDRDTKAIATTPPASPPPVKAKPAGLVSPKKLPRIPPTPHAASSDMFWSQDFVDDWNDQHSPRKQLFTDAIKTAKESSPKKKNTTTTITSPTKKKKNNDAAAASKPISAREAKKAFEKEKHALAQRFLEELDTVITNGKLSELAAPTGGIKLNWTNKLNTTAGRANWKRETIRTTTPVVDLTSNDSSSSAVVVVKHKHHASIELAEKVIDDEHRLLNVLAHEFCHLANFMISGVTTNPHGKEFKAWAAKCSAAFGSSRGIEVTTKHSYDIDFRYRWECGDCGMEYKRHSKSINPDRHRCGGCKGELRQTKPVPRGGGVSNGDKKKQPVMSEYQMFMKEQMKALKEENPKSPQKDIMKLVASRWAGEKGARGGGASSRRSETPSSSSSGAEETAKTLGGLKIEK